MQRIRLVVFLFAVVLATRAYSGNPPPTSAPVEMKLKWEVGKKYNLQITITQVRWTFASREPNRFDQTIESTRDFSVTAMRLRPEGGVELDMKLGELKLTIQKPSKILQFDTRQDPKTDGEDPTPAWLRKTIGMHLRFLTDTNGNVEKLVNLGEFMAQITNGAPEGMMSLASLFNEDAIKGTWFMTQALPAKPVAIGESWPYHYETKSATTRPLVEDLRITFKGWGYNAARRFAVIEFNGELIPKSGKEDPDETGKMKPGTVTGHIWLDVDTGTIVERETAHDLDYDIQTGGKTVTASLSQRVRVKLIRVVDAEK